MAEAAEPIRTTIAGGIATVRLNRPEVLNALTAPMAHAFLAAVRDFHARGDVRVVVLRGEGRGFCAGGDVASFQGASETLPGKIAAIMDPMHEALELLSRLPAPSIAQVHGVAAGGGLSLALACDFVVAAEGTRFSAAYARLGASPDVSLTYQLPRLVGVRKAKELVLLGDTFDAAEALRLGLVNRVVPAAELDATVEALAQRLAAGPTQAYGRIRGLIEGSLAADLHGQLAAEKNSFMGLSQTQDFTEGVTAFLGKRTPSFQGR